MRKVINILSIVTLLSAAVSCVKSDRIYDNSRSEIDMDPVMSVMSKAIVSGTGYPVDVPFGVFATYSSNPAGEWTSGPVQSYFENKKFIHKGDNKYGGESPAYWPLSGSLVFAGYSPYPDSGSVSATFDAETKTLSISNFVSNGQTDLMYFLPTLSNSGNYVGTLDKSNSVSAQFFHALSLVSFDMQVRDGDEDDIKLKKIILKDMYATGNFTVSASDPATAAWTRTSDASDITVFNSDAGKGLSPSVQVDVLVIPGAAVDIQIVYETKFYDMGESDVVEKNLTAEIVPSEVGVTTWETGKKYLYDVVIKANKIEVKPSTGYIGVIEKESQK